MYTATILLTRAYTGGARGCSAPPKPVKGGQSELSHLLNLKLKSEEHKKLVCYSFSAQRRLNTWNRSPSENIFRMYIHPNRMGAIRDSEVKQSCLNAKSRRFEFGGSKRPFFVVFS